MKVTPRTRNNFKLYKRCAGVFTFAGKILGVTDCITGATALEAFAVFDSEGKVIHCRESDELKRVLLGKAALNLQIKQWATGVREEAMTLVDLRWQYAWLPEWVWTAVERQARKSSA